MQKQTIAQIATTALKAEFGAAEAMAFYLGKEPTFEAWEAAAKEFKTEYAKARVAKVGDCTPEAAQKAWERVAASMAEFFDLKKPKAATKGAADKAEQRSKAKEEAEILLVDLVGENPTLEGLRKARGEAANEWSKHLQSGDNAGAAPARKKYEVIDKALAVAEKAAHKEAEKAVKDEAEGYKAELREWMKTATVAELKKVVTSIRKHKKAA